MTLLRSTHGLTSFAAAYVDPNAPGGADLIRACAVASPLLTTTMADFGAATIAHAANPQCVVLGYLTPTWQPYDPWAASLPESELLHDASGNRVLAWGAPPNGSYFVNPESIPWIDMLVERTEALLDFGCDGIYWDSAGYPFPTGLLPSDDPQIADWSDRSLALVDRVRQMSSGGPWLGNGLLSDTALDALPHFDGLLAEDFGDAGDPLRSWPSEEAWCRQLNFVLAAQAAFPTTLLAALSYYPVWLASKTGAGDIYYTPTVNKRRLLCQASWMLACGPHSAFAYQSDPQHPEPVGTLYAALGRPTVQTWERIEDAKGANGVYSRSWQHGGVEVDPVRQTATIYGPNGTVLARTT